MELGVWLSKDCSCCPAERRLENGQRAKRPQGGLEGRGVAEKWKGGSVLDWGPQNVVGGWVYGQGSTLG